MKKVNNKNRKKILYFLLSLVLLRPSLDILSQIEFQIHETLPFFNLNIIIGGLVFFICLLFFSKNIKNIYSTPLFYPISLFLILSLASVFYSIDPFNSIKEFIRIITIFLLYFMSYQLIKNKEDFWLLIKVILISYILPGIFALIQLIFGLGLSDDFGGFKRIYGTFAHPNPFAFYTFFILGLALALTLSKIRFEISRSFIYSWSFIAVLTFILFATRTRSAIACLFIFIIIFGVFKYRQILLAGILLFFFAYFFSEIFQQRLWELVALDPYSSIVWRFRLWRDIIPISMWQPWFGYGTGTFTNLVEFYRGFRWGSLEAHNDYLKIFVENGILGLITYFWLILNLLFYLFKIFRKTIDQEKILTLGILVICLSLFAASFFDNIFRETALQWNLWILLGAWLRINK